MTTPVVTRPPTEAEIREAIATRLDRIEWIGAWHDVQAPLLEPAWQAVGHSGPPDASTDPQPEWAALWWDLAPSQAAQLYRLLTDALDRASQRCGAILLEELTAAGVAFASEFPEAPRP